MPPDQINKLIDQKIQSAAASGQFNLNRIPYHVHNGKDSPFIFAPTLSYAGLVNSDSTISRDYPFPAGWKHGTAGAGTGNYLITHNLNTTFYSVAITPIASSVPVAFYVSNLVANSFVVRFFDSKLQTAVDTSFYFTVTAVTNTKPGWPAYKTNAT